MAARIGDDILFETPEEEVELSCTGAEPSWPADAGPYQGARPQSVAAQPNADGWALATSDSAPAAWALALVALRG